MILLVNVPPLVFHVSTAVPSSRVAKGGRATVQYKTLVKGVSVPGPLCEATMTSLPGVAGLGPAVMTLCSLDMILEDMLNVLSEVL